MNVPSSAQGYGGRADHQLQELEPDDFIDQGRTAAACEQNEQHRQKPGRRAAERAVGVGSCGVIGRLAPGKMDDASQKL